MSSVGVLMKKKSKCFVRKKSKCPKKNFQSGRRREKKIVSVEFRVFGKEKLKEKFRGKIFWGENLK
jgi:hypothetical protein